MQIDSFTPVATGQRKVGPVGNFIEEVQRQNGRGRSEGIGRQGDEGEMMPADPGCGKPPDTTLTQTSRVPLRNVA